MGFNTFVEGSMGGENLAFLAAADEHASTGPIRDGTSACALDASSGGCVKSPEEGNVAWLDRFRDEACSVVQYSNTSAIPRPIRTAFNVCVVKSGLSEAIPNAITTSRKTHVERFHSIVSTSEVKDVHLGNSETQRAEVEGQEFTSITDNGATSWGLEAPIHFEHARSLQELAPTVSDKSFSFETKLPSSVRLGISYFESMPYCLLPLGVGLGIVVVLLPLFLLLFCLRNCRCSQRLCSCFCCLRIFFKSTKRYAAEVERWQSNGSSTGPSGSQYRGSVRKLVPRSSCLGVRYLALILAFCTVAAVLSVGMYVLVDMGAHLSQVACAAGQAVSTIINGQTFAHPSAASVPNSAVVPLSSPSFSSTLFTSTSPPAAIVINNAPPFSPFLQSAPPDTTTERFPYLGEAIADPAFPRLLQQDDADLTEDTTAPKRTGFLGAVPALVYFKTLILALDPDGDNSLAKELRMASKVASRISQKVADMRINLQALKKTLYRPANSGMAVSSEPSDHEEATYHLSPVSVASPSLLSAWETTIHLLPSTFFAIAEASEHLAAEIEASMQQTDGLLAIKDMQKAKDVLTQTLKAAHPTVEKIPKIGTPLFWGSIVTFSLMGVLVLLGSLYLCCLCCCNREALVDRKATSCGCSFLLLLVSAAALVASGGLLVGSAMLTDGCLYTETYLKDEKDVEQLLQYFWRLKSGEGSPSEGSLHAPSRVAAKVLAACLLPNQERDLVQVFKIDELVKAGVKLKEAGRNAVEKEAIAARLVSLQLQDAAAELQLLKETYWLMLVDPMTLEQEDLDERLHTYKEVLCSGIQDKQRELKASYLGLFSTAAGTTTTAGTATSAPGEEEVPSRGRQNTFSLLQPGDRQPSEELAALLKQLSADRQAAERLSASFQEAIHAMKTSSTTSTSGGNGSSSSKWERAMKPMIEGVVGELMRLAADKTEAEKTQLLHEVVRLAGQAHAEVQASTEATGPTSSSSRAAAVRRRQKQQQGTQLLELLQDRCLQRGKIAASGAVRPADRLVVYGLEDVEEMVAPFFLPSLRSSRRSSSNSSSSRSSREDALMIDRSLDVDSPIVLDIAARKGSLEEQRQFINAVWWAVKKETLLAETNKSFRCPRTPEGDHTHTDGYPCNWEELQETIQLLLNKLQRQLESLWGELGPFFTARMRAFGVVGLDIESAAANADCRMVYNELQPLQELVCEQLRPLGANLALLLLLLAGAALMLLPCFCCVWRAAVQNKWMVKDKLKKREAPNSRRHREISPPWAHTEPTCINPPNAAAAAAVAAAAAAAAAATGVPQQTIQQRYYHTDKPRTVRNEDWS